MDLVEAGVKLALTQARNELAFIAGDALRGGPDRQAEADRLRAEIRRLAAERDKLKVREI